MVGKVAELEDKLAKASSDDVEGIKSKLESAEDTVKSLKDKLEEITASKKELEEALEAKDVEMSTVKEEFDKVSEELATIKAEALAKARADELSKEGVLRIGAGLEAQMEKIKAMDDEAFEAYKSELVDLKKTIASQLKKADSPKDAPKDSAALNIEPDNNDEPSPQDLGKAMCAVFGIGSDK